MTALKYFVVDGTDVNKINWKSVVESSAENCRWNKSKTKLILKGPKVPKWYVNKPIYSLYDIKEILRNGEW